ncbi:MAG: hypothetical protein HKN42_07925 [Granulosicoccus sp.]|nr:hypothetical protein [Granulosicoccus sp.]
MNYKLHNVTRNLRELIKALPAVRANCSAEVIDRHIRLIAHFQRQYDQLVRATAGLPSPA